MAIMQVLLPILIGFAVIAGLVMLIDRHRRTPGDTTGYDRLTDVARPTEAHRPSGINDEFHH